MFRPPLPHPRPQHIRPHRRIWGDDGVVRVWDLGSLLPSSSSPSGSGSSSPSSFFEATATTIGKTGTGNGDASGEGGEDG
ncbi:hypothetical protein D9758_011248 [Tetrapyrgos nigripes]|uniref:Uncharacterized protein n=1 Tax=Tetrapyrgos nigripes TaxID=182062 RepID=A0A8H5FZI1_9AGAR|nr:hypothetical protein D9758_011248 [Tetrapyrgos nigripes]